MKSVPQTPVLQALVLAEHIYQDTSGRKIICGTFNRLFLREPSGPVELEDEKGNKVSLIEGGQPGAPWAYISLTDVCDNTTLDLQFVSLSDNKVLFEQSITVKNTDRLKTIEIIAPLPLLPVRSAGVYAFEVVCESEIIGSHRLNAVELPNQE